MLLQSVLISIGVSLDIVINFGTRRSHVDNETNHVMGVSVYIGIHKEMKGG